MFDRARRVVSVFWRVLDRVGWIIALVFLAIGFVIVHNQGVTENELHTSQLRACHRLNVIRAEDNHSQLQDFHVFTATADLIAQAIAHPERPASPQQKAIARAYLAGIMADTLAKEWTPLTKCYPATNHPASYVAPEPIPFARMLPPSSALHVSTGE